MVILAKYFNNSSKLHNNILKISVIESQGSISIYL